MGNDFRFGIEINSGRGHGHGHGHGNDPWAGDRFPYPQPQPRIDPITVEARQIANDLDRGDMQRAANRLNRDLQQLPDFHDQRRLVEQINLFDRKGVGADLNLHSRPDRRGGVWDDISISPPRYYDRGHGHGNGGYRPGYPNYPRGPIYNGQPQVDIHIDLNLFKNRR